MLKTSQVLTAASLVALGVFAVACTDEAATPEVAANAPAETAAPAEPAAPVLPPLPEWVSPHLGKAMPDIFAVTSGPTNCIGSFDFKVASFPDGSRYEGWGWNVIGKAPYAHVAVADQFNVVVGGGESGLDRPDVMQAVPQTVTQPASGFWVLAKAPAGPMIAYGIDETTKTACQLGTFIPPAG